MQVPALNYAAAMQEEQLVRAALSANARAEIASEGSGVNEGAGGAGGRTDQVSFLPKRGAQPVLTTHHRVA
jgi:hypothetical protein